MADLKHRALALSLAEDSARLEEWRAYRDNLLSEAARGLVKGVRLHSCDQNFTLLTHCPRCGSEDLVHWSRREERGDIEITCAACHKAGRRGWYTVFIDRGDQ